MGINKNALVWRGKLLGLIEKKGFFPSFYEYRGMNVSIFNKDSDNTFKMTPRGVKQACKWLESQPDKE